MTRAFLRVPETHESWREALAGELEPGDPEAGLIFVPNRVADEWEAVAAEFGEAFELTRRAASGDAPVVYVVGSADLHGQRGAGPAMVACGLLSGARTLAFETRKAGTPANVLAVDEESRPDRIARWARRLLERDGPSGELVRLGAHHLGKALP